MHSLLHPAALALALALPAGGAPYASPVDSGNAPGTPQHVNPFLKPYDTPFGIPPYEQISVSDFIPAAKAGLEEQRANLERITKQTEAPTFDNTILPLENLSPILERMQGVFFQYDSALKTDELSAVADELMPLLLQAQNEVMLSEPLFARLRTLLDALPGSKLTPVQKRLVQKYYKEFAQQGAALSPEQKQQLIRVNEELSKLFIKFNKNLLRATNEFQLVVYNEADLAGLPASAVATAAEVAQVCGLTGLHVFTLHESSRLPVLTYADCRPLREAMWRGYTALASRGETDNAPVIEQIVRLRAEKAKIMGFTDFASMMTSRVMAGTPGAAEELLKKVYEPSCERVKQEVAEMQRYVDAHGGGFQIEPWDYYYYAQRVRQEKFHLSDADLQPYFSLEGTLEGLRYCAERLYGIKFVPLEGAPKYMDQVKTYDIQDRQGRHLAVFMTDYFPRATKVQGAWMDQLQSAGLGADGKQQRPIVFNVGNFTPPTRQTPSLLTLDEVQTTFHEFGHALQGMLTQAPYKSLAGTDVDRDYVELCSQINEHWATAPEVLAVYAKHYQTGEPMPRELIERMQEAMKFGQGFAACELAAASLLDLAWGHTDSPHGTVADFEQHFAEQIKLPRELTFRYRSTYFKHIFGDDGYASGYYTYLWSQVLEADAWELFQQRGIFDRRTADSFRRNILESGDTEDPMTLFVRFRGHKPDASALLRLRGLVD